MIEATSCGGVVIFRGKILVLYKNYKNKYEGWVLPKGTVEAGGGIQRDGSSGSQRGDRRECIHYQIHWKKLLFLQYAAGYGGERRTRYLMMADSYYSKPQREEHFWIPGITSFMRLTTF